MMYLVDVNVICEPGKLRPNERVQKWLDENESVSTRNIDDFKRCGVPVVNPIE
jgi:predicted nucleic acid-binding protein